jgi:cytochrome P450
MILICECGRATSEWAMAEVLRNPSLVAKAKAELDRVVGFTRTVQESDIPNLKYIQAIVKEALRLHAPLPFLLPHQSINATTAFGYDIPAKTRLFVNIWGIGRDPEVWENPGEFAPERFLDGTNAGATEFQGQHFELIPFGAGRRLCPGMAFASVAVHLQVASLLHAFEWSFPDGMAAEELDMSEGWSLTLERRDPLVALAAPRLPSHLYQN